MLGHVEGFWGRGDRSHASHVEAEAELLGQPPQPVMVQLTGQPTTEACGCVEQHVLWAFAAEAGAGFLGSRAGKT